MYATRRGYGKGVGVYDTLVQSDTVQSYGLGKEGTRTVGVERHKKPKDLSVSDREECGYGKGMGVHTTLLQSVRYSTNIRSLKDRHKVCFFFYLRGKGRSNTTTSPKHTRGSINLFLWIFRVLRSPFLNQFHISLVKCV